MNAYDDSDRPAGGQSDTLPLGLGMSLMKEPAALHAFGNLSMADKSRVIAYVQCSVTGEEAKQRIETAVSGLASGSMGFLG